MSRYSQALLDHARYPSNRGTIENTINVGRASLSGNPPYISIFLAIEDKTIKQAKFQSHGCGITTAICSVTTELLTGANVDVILTNKEICDELDGVPPDKLHCIQIVLKALDDALNRSQHE